MRAIFPVRLAVLVTASLACVLTAPRASSKDLKITLPKRSPLTPVQRLNREGVDEIRKHRYVIKAENLFFIKRIFSIQVTRSRFSTSDTYLNFRAT